ncbi:hypothetical protein [Streptomyces sp. SGAir0957]
MDERCEEQLRADIWDLVDALDAFADEVKDLPGAERLVRAADLYARLDRLQARVIDQAVAGVSVPDFPPAPDPC